jgi:hypothetical protein
VHEIPFLDQKRSIANFLERRNRPVYVCVRSCEAWLEPVLADPGKEGQTAPAVPSGVSKLDGKKYTVV